MPKVTYQYEDVLRACADRGYVIVSPVRKNWRSRISYFCPKHGLNNVRTDHLMHGHGCSKCGNEKGAALLRTHGRTPSRLYKIWSGMRYRCLHKNSPAYKNYGGRGVTIIPEWSCYEVFRDWALANGYTDTLEIERIDVNGNYTPENCCWITPEQQASNRRTGWLLTLDGVTRKLKEWVPILGIKYKTLCWRVAHGYYEGRVTRIGG